MSEDAAGRCAPSPTGKSRERGGELIDQSHTHIRQLAQELGLARQPPPRRAERHGAAVLLRRRALHTRSDDDLNGIYQKLHRDVSQASYPTLFDSYTSRGCELDQMSIVDWIEEERSRRDVVELSQLLDVATRSSTAASRATRARSTSCTCSPTPARASSVFRAVEREVPRARRQRPDPTTMANALSRQISSGTSSSPSSSHPDDRLLDVPNGSGTKPVAADRLVLALPFSILRTSVNYTKAGFEQLKVTAIEELGMGTNSSWLRRFGATGRASLQRRDVRRHRLSVHVGRDTGTGRGGRHPGGLQRGTIGDSWLGRRDVCAQFCPRSSRCCPGSRTAGTASRLSTHGPDYEWTRGSYSYWKVGQYTKFAGMERKRQVNCHFRRAHVDRLPGLPERRRRVREARCRLEYSPT